MTLRLVIGNKNYSSWSFRPWIAMKVAGIPFDETVVYLDAPDFKAQVTKISGTGKVPAIAHGDVHIWESLAILEYLAETFREAQLWPGDRAARAHARAVANEMHAGFLALRKEMPMNMWRPPQPRALSDDAKANVARVDALWTGCRQRFGKGGPFLFGRFSNADAMYAPVVSRFSTYAVEVGAVSRDYMKAMMDLPAWKEWTAAAFKETSVLPHDEIDWPTVKRMEAAG